MNLLMIEFSVIVVNTNEEGVQKIVGTTPTYISMDKIKYFHKIDKQLAKELCNNSGDINPETVSNYTVFQFGESESILVAEPFDDVVTKLVEANAIFQSRRMNG